MFKCLTALQVVVVLFFSNLQFSYAQDFNINQLPVPGKMVGESLPFVPLALKGLVVDPKKPLEFQFIVDTGKASQDATSIKEEASKLVKYFLAGLTIPEGEVWVNLSPYEKNRITSAPLGQTELGRDLLAQDYVLKQLTASLIYPEKSLGKEFWNRVYAKTQQEFGTTNISVNTFNKVWIVPDQAQVYENSSSVYVTRATLKVMLEEDYLSLKKHVLVDQIVDKNKTHSVASQIVREIVLPELEKEVNQGQNFAPLRQIYDAMILAKWYKETVANKILDTVYTNKDKIRGINLSNPQVKEQIYQRYLQAYKKGVFNYIQEDQALDGAITPKKYFSGGFTELGMKLDRSGSPAMISADGAMLSIKVILIEMANKIRTMGQSLGLNFSSREVPHQERETIPKVRKEIFTVDQVKKIFQDAIKIKPSDADVLSVVNRSPVSRWYSAVRRTIDAVVEHPITVYYPGAATDITRPLITTKGDVFLFVDVGGDDSINSIVSSIRGKIKRLGGNVLNEKILNKTEAEIDFEYAGKVRKLYYFNKIDASKVDTLPQKVKDGFDVYMEKLLRNGYGTVNRDEVLHTALPYLHKGGFLLTDYRVTEAVKASGYSTVGVVYNKDTKTIDNDNFLTYFDDFFISKETSKPTLYRIATRRKKMFNIMDTYRFEVDSKDIIGIAAAEQNSDRPIGSIIAFPRDISGETGIANPEHLKNTVFEESYKVPRRHQNSGLKWVLRMKAMHEAIKEGYLYYAFIQNDAFSEEDLNSEVRDLYQIDARLVYLKRGLSDHKQYVVFELQKQDADRAMSNTAPLKENTTPTGGIDLNTISIKRTGHVIQIQPDLAQISAIEQSDFEGFSPVITNMIRIKNPVSSFGITQARN